MSSTESTGQEFGGVHGKVVIVTGSGSSRGIGFAAAIRFAKAGARALYLCDLEEGRLEDRKNDLAKSFPSVDVHTKSFDAADESSVKAVIEDALQTYGRLDAVFANAGVVGRTVPFNECSGDEFLSVLRTNSMSVFLLAKFAAPAMMKTSAEKPRPGGSIIGNSSIAALRANAGPTPYAASKAAIVSIVQTMAFQLSGTGIRVNAVCPGIIKTDMTASIFDDAREKGEEDKIGQLNPLQRAGSPDEIARVVLFLASDASSYLNGQALAVDGGLSAVHPSVVGKL